LEEILVGMQYLYFVDIYYAGFAVHPNGGVHFGLVHGEESGDGRQCGG